MALTQREAFARLMEHMCSHDGSNGHGYSQPNREGKGFELVDLGDGVKVWIKSGDRDCSSAICTCLKALGIDIHGASYTGNILNLTKNPLFKAYKRPTSYSAKRGDIYLNTSYHTAMCTYGANEKGGDMLCQFSISENGTVNGATGDQTGKESNFKPFYDYPWNYTIAWASNGKTVSGTLNYVGASGASNSTTSMESGKIDVDGHIGKNTVTAWQKQLGTTADGVISGQSKSDKAAHERINAIRYGSGGSDMVRALQKFLISKGYSCGKTGADGLMGANTVKALQKWMREKLGYKKHAIDGILGEYTAYNVQNAINAGAFK